MTDAWLPRRLGVAWADRLVVALVLVGTAAVGAYAAAAPLVFVTTVAGLALVLLAVRQPDVATVLVLAVVYSNAAVVAVTVHGLPFVLGAGLPLLLLAPLVYQLVALRRPIVLGVAAPWLVALLVIQVVSALLAESPGDTFGRLLTFATEGFGLYVLVVNTVRTPETLRKVIVGVVTVGALLGGLSLLQQVTGTHHISYLGFAQVSEGTVIDWSDWRTWDAIAEPPTQIRASGPVGETNFFGFTLVVLLPLAAWLVATGRGPGARLLALGAVGLLGAGIALTTSRGAAATILITVVLLSLGRVLPRGASVAVAIAAVIALALVPTYRDRLAELSTVANVADARAASSEQADAATRGRYSELLAAAGVYVDNPVIGVGPGQFASYYQEYAQPLGFFVHDGPREAHNIYLHIAAELGTVGFVAFFGALGVTFVRTLQAHRRLRGTGSPLAGLAVALLAAQTAVLVNGLFLHLAYERYVWLLVALAAAFDLITRSGEDDTEDVSSRQTAGVSA